MSRHRKKYSYQMENEQTFMEDLERDLLTIPDPYGIDAFEEMFNRKKRINDHLEKEKQYKMQSKDSYQRAKQRVMQIKQLNHKVEKQTSLIKSQIEKINDVHNMSKILMLEKIIKLQRETEELEKKKNKCYEARADHNRSLLQSQHRMLNKIEKNRDGSLEKTRALQSQLEQAKFHAFQNNRKMAESVRSEKQRIKNKFAKIEEFKLNRARKNYTSKAESLQNRIINAEEQLFKLYQKQKQQQKHYQATTNLNAEDMSSFFPTATI